MTIVETGEGTESLPFNDFSANAFETQLLKLLGAPEEDSVGPWDGALCAETDPEAFFPEKGESAVEAKRICASCPLVETCLQFALDHGEDYGIWGGMTTIERKRYAQSDEEFRQAA